MTAPLSYPPPPARVISFARRGDSVQLLNIAGRLEPFLVLSNCGAPRHTYFCITCQLGLHNWGQLEMHVEAGGEHQLVRWCQKHGTPEGPDDGDVERLARYQQLESGL